ncbi:MAG: MlaD family protein [Gemmatimonadota bacterium]|jgi:phospholipid/cholesterol/gamma-HCH transport system substrate-binding protein|nr:MlaD family protein [Gemmatimonadota bacterium]
MRLKNEIVVGMVVVLGAVLTVVGAFWLSGRPWGESQRELVAVFVEVGGLRSGNPVKFRGVEVGRITKIELDPSVGGVLVTMDVSPRAELPVDTGVLLTSASLFGDWQAQIVSRAAYPDEQFTGGNPPGVLPGATQPDITQLTAVGNRIASDLQVLAQRVELAFTEETALKIRETIENVEGISQQLAGFVDQQTNVYHDVSQNVLAAAENITQTTARVGRVATEVEAVFVEGGEVQRILGNVRQASQNLEDLSIRLDQATAGIPSLVSRADTTLGDLGHLAASTADLLDSVEPQVHEIGPAIAEMRHGIATLERTLARVESGDGTLGRMVGDPALYEETQATITALRRMLADIQANPERYIGAVRIF